MFNDNLKKFNNVIAVLMSAIFAAGVVIGCGAKAEDPGGDSVAIAAEKSTEAPVVVAEEVDEVEESVDILDREKPKELGYYEEVTDGGRTEIRYNSELDGLDDPRATNKWIMIEEVSGDRDDLKVKGTLYEVFFNGRPDLDLVYFPGDKLPEGYEVKVTEDCEVDLSTSDFDLHNGVEEVYGSTYTAEVDGSAYLIKDGIMSKDLPAYLVKEDAHKISYAGYWDGYCPGPKSGMYGMLYTDTKIFDGYDPSTRTCFVQALLKDQMPTDGTEVSDNVMHQ